MMGHTQRSTMAAVSMGLIAALTTVPVAWSLPKLGPIGPGTTGPVIVIEDLPPTAPSLDVMTREATAITLLVTDHATDEQGYELQRRPADDSNPWTPIATWGPQTGQFQYTNTGLQPDSVYCYRMRIFNNKGSKFSPQYCAYTLDGKAYDVWRAQIIFHTADRSDAGTDDSIYVQLNGSANALPGGNWTWLDYARDDFERGDTFAYDLNLDGIGELGDINQIYIGKQGDDGWCLADFALKVNGIEVYNQDFSGLPGGCRWIDEDDGHFWAYVVPHATLRAHPAWANYNHTAALFTLGLAGIPNAEIVSRLESMTGDMIHDNELYWGDISGAAVEVTRGCPAGVEPCPTIHVDLDLAADVFGPDPGVDVDFDLTFACDNGILSVTSSNVVIDADSDWFWEVLSLGLINFVDSEVKDRVIAGWDAINEAIGVGAGCIVSVNDNGDIFFEAVESDPADGGVTPPVGPDVIKDLSTLPVVELEPADGGTTPPNRPGLKDLSTLSRTLRGSLTR